MARTDSTLTIRMNRNIKEEAQVLFSELGMDISTAINVFLRQALRTRGFPFEIKTDEPNETTLKAFEEGEKLLADPNTKRYATVDELFEDLNS